MSSSLVWKPVVYPNSHYLDDQLKFILRKIYGNPINHRFVSGDIPILKGIVATGSNGSKDAQKLIDLIEKHEEIDVVEEF